MAFYIDLYRYSDKQKSIMIMNRFITNTHMITILQEDIFVQSMVY